MKTFTVEGFSGFFNIEAKSLNEAWELALQDGRSNKIGGITAIRPLAKGEKI